MNPVMQAMVHACTEYRRDVHLCYRNGNKIKAIKDFDHSEPDEDGNIYYPVPASDVDGDDYEMFTPEACEKWRSRLGL